ncbi:MAG: hypothetical protein WCT33_03920 [Patescibacteria group bacterium]|jgi:hypothetical protein
MDLWPYIINREFDNFHNFRNYILTSTKNDKEKKILLWEDFKKSKGKDIDITEEEYDLHIIDINEEINETEQLLYESYIVSIFIFLERQFAYLCNFIKEKQNNIFTYKDLKGNGIQRNVVYIEKLLEHPFPEIEHLRNKFKISLKIRNTIVHTNGELEDSKDKEMIVKYIKDEMSEIRIINGHLHFNTKYIENLTGVAQGICGEINQIRKTFK